MDPRLTACNGSYADIALRGKVDAEHFVEGEPACVATPLADVYNAPQGARIRQFLCGTELRVYEWRENLAFVQNQKDSYVGWVETSALSKDPIEKTHKVIVPTAHLYEEPDFKSKLIGHVTLGAEVRVDALSNDYHQTPRGWLYHRTLSTLSEFASDPVRIAEMFLETPYLWGANSALGLDCSGLVQLSCHACGLPCPADSDLQERELGAPLDSTENLRRGDLIFWKGHVAWVHSPKTLIHANAFHMSVQIEDTETALKRIAATSTGAPTGFKRLTAS